MKEPTKYFTKDSTIFTIVSFVLLIIGNPDLLFIWLILSAIFILIKRPSKVSPKKFSKPGLFLSILFTTLIVGTGLGLLPGFLIGLMVFYICYFAKTE